MLAIRSTHNPDNLRGAGLDYAILDEAAFMAPDVWHNVVRPMLLDRRGRALFLSTPYGRNWFWEVFKIGIDPEEPSWQSFRFMSYDNPLIDSDELDSIRRNTPDRIFREEYLAQFADDIGRVFRGVHEAAHAPLFAVPHPRGRYVMGVDWGRENDYTAVVVIEADSGVMVALDRFNQIGWSLQRGRLRTLVERWSPEVILAEANSIGTVNIEALQNEGLPVRAFMTTSRSKRPLIESLALAIERRDIALLPDPVLLGELASYEAERMSEGGFRYNAPPGAHDDTVIATALAWNAANAGNVRVDFA